MCPIWECFFGTFFSHMNIVKTSIRSKLLSKSLNSVLQIHMTDLSVNEFNLLYTDDCVSYWYNNKEWKINQWERKCYKKGHDNVVQRDSSGTFRTCLHHHPQMRVNQIHLLEMLKVSSYPFSKKTFQSQKNNASATASSLVP